MVIDARALHLLSTFCALLSVCLYSLFLGDLLALLESWR